MAPRCRTGQVGRGGSRLPNAPAAAARPLGHHPGGQLGEHPEVGACGPGAMSPLPLGLQGGLHETGEEDSTP